jgi:hypothetical protein
MSGDLALRVSDSYQGIVLAMPYAPHYMCRLQPLREALQRLKA